MDLRFNIINKTKSRKSDKNIKKTKYRICFLFNTEKRIKPIFRKAWDVANRFDKDTYGFIRKGIKYKISFMLETEEEISPIIREIEKVFIKLDYNIWCYYNIISSPEEIVSMLEVVKLMFRDDDVNDKEIVIDNKIIRKVLNQQIREHKKDIKKIKISV